MYLDYFGFSEKPFTITPNPRFVFLSTNHREVFAHLLYGIRQHAGFIEVTGEVGTGKTTVLRSLFAELEDEGCRIAYVFNPALTAPELLRTINREFGLPHEDLTPAALHGALNDFLLAENQAGRTVVLVIDEAQNLEVAVLEQIRLLSNLETASDKLIQIVLVGQPELGRLLERSELRQLSQRITVRYHLREMNFTDSCAYIEHRLRIAGHQGRPIFTVAALRGVYRRTGGNPRLINVLCDRALLVAFTAHADIVSPQHVAAAARELRRSTHTPWRRWLWPVAAVAAALVLTVMMRGLPNAVPPASLAPPPAAAAASVAAESFPTVPGGSAALWSAYAAVARRWDVTAAAPVPRMPQSTEELLELARQRGFETVRFQGDLDPLLRLDLPFILEVAGQGGEESLLAVARRRGATLLVTTAEGETAVSTELLRRHWSGRAYLLWRNPLRVSVTEGIPRDAVGMVQLQTLLIEAGASAVVTSGRNDAATTAAIRHFQLREGMPGDGLIGPQTLMALYRASGRHGYPRLSNGEGPL